MVWFPSGQWLRIAIASAMALTCASGLAQTVPVVEFYNASLDHYFISANPQEIGDLDTGVHKGWARTGQTFNVYPAATTGANPVCRFYIPPQHGDSHFFSASPAECATILNYSTNPSDPHYPNYNGFDYESPNVFYIALPDTATGECPTGTIPVFRLWNNRADSNHRYTTDPAIKVQMTQKGYIAEGYGPDAVIMCAPVPSGSLSSALVINGIAWAGTQFVAAAGEAGVGGVVITSSDGVTWTPRPMNTNGLRGVAWSGTLTVVVGVNGSVVTSPDGVMWTVQNSGSAADLNWVAWTANHFVAVGTGGTILTSSDGISWKPRTSGTAKELFGVTANATTAIAVGDSGTILSSVDGVTWLPQVSGTVNHLLDVKWSGSQFIVPGSGGTILTSPDGSAWTRQNSGIGSGLHGAAWSGSVFAVVGAGGHILTSANGSAWMPRTSGTANNLADVAWSGTQFAAVGANGAIVTSPDGVAWTTR